jgi:hypothetical protein
MKVLTWNVHTDASLRRPHQYHHNFDDLEVLKKLPTELPKNPEKWPKSLKKRPKM